MNRQCPSSKLKALDLYINENKSIEVIATETGLGEIYVISWIHHYLLEQHNVDRIKDNKNEENDHFVIL